MGEVSLISPGPAGNKTSVGFAGQAEMRDLSFHSVPSCWDGIKMHEERDNLSELQVGTASFTGIAHPVSLPQ